ncbi:MAG: glycosyltransferase [Candidatus Omnitrophota bacterium]
MNKFISIVVPCRNEEQFIAETIKSLLSQDYDPLRYEILIVDGQSVDGTRTIILKFEKEYPGRVRLIDNPQKTTPYALNYGVKAAKGDLVIIMGAHAYYQRDYLSQCARGIETYQVDCVGGVIKTLPALTNTLQARAIAMVLSSSFGVGNSSFRTGVKDSCVVDTVPFGCYRREVFEKAGYFDTDFIRNQDDEFNHRMTKMGLKMLLIPGIETSYYARDSWSRLWIMYFQYGYFKPLSAVKHGKIFTWRQLVPAFLILSLVVLGVAAVFNLFFKWLWLAEVLIYVTANILVALKLAFAGGISLFPFLLIAFVTIHFGYGIGYIQGILDFMLLKKHLKNKIKDMAISR